MQIQVINIARKLPAWVDNACDEYLRRMPREISLKLVTVPLGARKPGQADSRQLQRESGRMLDKLTPGSLNLALDQNGEPWSSADWSSNLGCWMLESPRVNLLIGGPDGLSQSCLEVCRRRISLGRMTLPHALARVVVVEQLYRAWTIRQGHPYHRE